MRSPDINAHMLAPEESRWLGGPSPTLTGHQTCSRVGHPQQEFAVTLMPTQHPCSQKYSWPTYRLLRSKNTKLLMFLTKIIYEAEKGIVIEKNNFDPMLGLFLWL